MSKQSDAIQFTVEIPHDVERELKKETGIYSRYELVADSVKEFNERKHELDERGFADGDFHERKDVKILKLSSGVVVSYEVINDVPTQFDLKQEYIKLKQQYESLVNSLQDDVTKARKVLGGLG